MAALEVLEDVLDVDPDHVDALAVEGSDPPPVLAPHRGCSERRPPQPKISMAWFSRPESARDWVTSRRRGQSWRAVLDARPAHREATLSLDVLEMKQRLGWSTHSLDLSQERDLAVVDEVRSSIIRTRLGTESWWDDAYVDHPPA